LIESELFGHKKGAFTGAITDRQGLIEEANGGTFFFDEIADISPYLQAKLLSVIEDKELRRVGENRARNIDVRFILATNKDLPKLVANGKFRKDLYYRISILAFQISPLRERKEDIPLFVEWFLNEIDAEFKKEKKLNPKALQKIMEYSFPGNVRELENLIRRGYVLAERKEINPENIIFEEGGEEEEVPAMLLKEMVIKGRNFWEVVHEPFIRRDLNRRQVKDVISLGLKKTGGSYKNLLFLFNMGSGKKEYKKFIDIIRHFKLR
jgi:transcriptional regulator with GAF, ATPase, and Fis domain